MWAARLLFAAVLCLPLPEVSAADQTDRLTADIEFLTSNGSRAVGYPGAAAAAGLIEDRFRDLGLNEVRRREYPVGMPMDRGASLTVAESGLSAPLLCLWPNLVRTSTLPPEGLSLPLVYAGSGEWAELNGSELEGRAVLMEFNSGLNWLRPASLGAVAVLFIEPEETTAREAQRKYAVAPLDVPRFWIDARSGKQLRRRLAEGGELAVTLRGRMDWEMRPAWNLTALLPGSDPELAGETVVLQAYYDAASVVPALAPGATAACGTAALLETARHLASRPPARSVLFLAASAHYQAQQGIVDFVNRRARTHEEYSARFGEPLDIALFVGLDLSGGSDQLGIWNNLPGDELRRFFLPYSRVFMAHGEAAAGTQGRDPERAFLNGVSPVRGRSWESLAPGGINPDAGWAHAAGVPALTLATVNDGRQLESTPLDRGVDIPNLDRQVELLKRMLAGVLDDPGLSSGRAALAGVVKDRMRDLIVQTRQYPRRSQVPDRPVPGALVVLNTYDKQKTGVHGQRAAIADGDGNAVFRGIPSTVEKLAAFELDPASGAILAAPDLAQRAANHHGKPLPDGWLGAAAARSVNIKTVVLFKAVGGEIYSLIRPRSLLGYGGPTVMDQGGAEPRQFGFLLSRYPEEPAGVLFGPALRGEENRLRFLFGGLLEQRLLLLNSQGHRSEEEARGIGYSMGEEPLTRLTEKAARDMWRLDEQRLEKLREHSISSRGLELLHRGAGARLEEAVAAARELRWDRYVARTREALGLEARVYPEILATLNDVIKGMVFFLALVVPAAFFGERLFFAAADIRRQLLGLAVLVLLIWMILSQVHPAFDIAHPLVIVLAFLIMAMAVLVMWMVSARFNRTAAEYRSRVGQVHRADISRLGAAYVAFMLGISNMRRRKLRTAMTLTTLTLLTFSVLSFTSFEDRIRFVAMPVPFEGEREGLLIRGRNWGQLKYPAWDYAQSHFGSEAILAPRYWHSGLEGGASYVEVRRGERVARALGMIGLAPGERLVTGVDRCLVAGSFFESGEEASCLLPDEMAEALGLSAADAGSVRVRVFGRDLLVRGIFSAAALDGLRDLDGGSLTPIDTRVAAFDPLDQLLEEGGEGEGEAAALEMTAALRLPAANVLITPHRTQQDFGGALYSVGGSFREEARPVELIEKYLLRVAAFMYAGIGDDAGGVSVYRYSSVGLTSVRGLGALAIPAVIAAMIVLNAMLGAVYERFREIGIYSSVGLAPVHISVLFLAEATVYAILGVTMGYLLGQGLGKLLIALDMLSGITLNYSSVSAVVAALAVMAIVLLSTLHPARVAARAAVPEAVRRWRPPDPEGDRWDFAFPFNVSESEAAATCGFLHSFLTAHGGAVGGRMYTEGVALRRHETPDGPAYRIDFRMWLAPYDLGVSEEVGIELTPVDGAPGMYAIAIEIERRSGEQLNWRRLNGPFFNTLRRQLLIWNTLPAETRAGHRSTAERLLEAGPGRPEDPASAEPSLSASTPEERPREGSGEERRSPFSWRAIGIGTAGAMAVGVGAPYCVFMLKGSWMAINSTVPIALFYFFIVVVIANVVLGLAARRWELRKADLILVYVMLTMAAAVPNQAFVGYVIPCIAGFFYYATPENKWLDMYLADVPKWMVPEVRAAELLHEGLPPGEPVPWQGWAEPLTWWYLFFLALGLMMICLNVILHRQWSVHERLEYPMVQVPLHMIERSQGAFAPLGPFFRNPWTWIGFLVPFLLLGLHGLRHYYPAVPAFSPSFGALTLMDGAFVLKFHTNYAWIGISYLVNLDVTLSIWVFWILGVFQKAMFGKLGVAPTETLSFYSLHSADLAHQATGACWVFVVWGLWVARRHLRQVLSNAFGRKAVDDSEELISYRAAVLGFGAGFLFVGAWLWKSGIPLVVLPMFLVSALIFYILVTRVVATAGVATARSPMISAFVVISGLGSAFIGTKGLVALTFTYLWHSEMRLFPMVVCAQNLKLAETVRGPKGRLFWAICIALVVSLLAATWIILHLCYTYGGINLHTFFMQSQSVRLFNDMARHIQHPVGPDLRGWGFTGVGAAVEAGLIYAQKRFFWWPLHPVGFVIANGWLTGQIWFAVFLGWLAKFVIIRNGGMQLFLAARPFFIGLILGEATAAGTWLVIDYLLGSTGNHITHM